MTPLILAVAAMLAASDASQVPSVAQATTTATAGAASKPAPDPNKIVCKDEELTGSRFTRRVCKTRAQWEAKQDAADNYKREIEDRNGLNGPQVGPFGQ